MEGGVPVSIDILPDDIVENILACLPLSAISETSYVCKKWNDILHSPKFTLNVLLDKTWYFMAICSDEPLGYIYSSVMHKWYYPYELPFMVNSKSVINSSDGLLCIMDDEANNELCIYNPLTKKHDVLESPPNAGIPQFPLYSALTFSIDKSKSKYTVSVVGSMQASENFMLCNFYVVFFDYNYDYTVQNNNYD